MLPFSLDEVTFWILVIYQDIETLMTVSWLRLGTTYTVTGNSTRIDFRYGSLMIMVDPDQDESHINGLEINFFH
jgi:DNA gyrase/topoisomerase IV subunit B